MTKINFQNNVTKCSAETFNTMQDNIETAINTVEASVPTLDDEVDTSSTNGVENQAITNYVNTKGIYESGSNASGSYIKYDDGTMICYKEIEQNISSLIQDSNYYYFNIENIIFPQTFYSKPIVNVSLENSSEFRRLSVGGTFNVSTTGIGHITVWNYWSSTDDRVYISIIAIGRWQ